MRADGYTGRLHATDYSEIVIRQLRRRAPRGADVECSTMDARHLKFADQSFDVRAHMAAAQTPSSFDQQRGADVRGAN